MDVPACRRPPTSGPSASRLARFSRAQFVAPMIVAGATLGILVNEFTYRNTVEAVRVGGALVEARIAAAGLLQVLTDAETGQRGYLLTGRAEYLAPLVSARIE